MKANLEATLNAILESEGLDVNNSPGEPGGISKGGVSLTAMNDYRRTCNLPLMDKPQIAALTADQIKDFYTNAFLPRICFDDLPAGVDFRLADIEVNSGQAGAVWILELTLGIWPITNVMTQALVLAAQRANPHDTIIAMGAVWIGTKFKSSGWTQYGHGWTNRNNRVMRQALALIGGQ